MPDAPTPVPDDGTGLVAPSFIDSQYLITGLVVPCVMLLVAVLCKLLTKKGKLEWDDFLLGVDACLAALTSGLAHGCQVYFQYKRLRHSVDAAYIFDQLGKSALFCLLVVVVLLAVLVIHQRWLPVSHTNRLR